MEVSRGREFLTRLIVVRRRTQGAERCSASGSKLGVQMPELAACRFRRQEWRSLAPGCSRLQVRRASWRDEAQHDVEKSGLHGGQGGLASVDAGHDGSTIVLAVVADSVLLHEPAQLDEQSMRVGVLMFRVVELCQALGGLLVAQAHATQQLQGRTSSPSLSSHTSTKLWIVTSHKHRTWVTRKHRRWTSQAPLHVQWSFYPSPAPHVEEPVAGDGVDVASRV